MTSHHSCLLSVLLLLLAALSSCSSNGDYSLSSESRLVVEASIEAGEFPVVMLTRTVPVSSEYQDLSDLSKYVERWARVSISDGEQEVVLVGRIDRSYTPAFVYTTSQMRGVAGRRYTIRIHCTDGFETEAVTEIPMEEAVVDRFSAERTADSDTLYQVYAHIDTLRTTARYLRLSEQHELGKLGLLPSMFGIFSREMISQGRVSVNRGRSNLFTGYTPFFSLNDTIVVRISAISEEQYDYWRGFEDMIALSRNPLFPVTDNLPGNLPGCAGYWFGAVSNYYLVPVRQLVE